MGIKIQTERRWLRSVIAASTEPLPNFPWMRGQRRRPASLDAAPQAPHAPAKLTVFTRSTAAQAAYPSAIAAR